MKRIVQNHLEILHLPIKLEIECLCLLEIDSSFIMQSMFSNLYLKSTNIRNRVAFGLLGCKTS